MKVPRPSRLRTLTIHTTLFLSLTVFCLYSLQEVAFNQMEDSLRREYSRPPILGVLDISEHQAEDNQTGDLDDEIGHDTDDPDFKVMTQKNQTEEMKERKVWVTMGLCWGENTQYHGKQDFPYFEAAQRSIPLWHSLTPARVIMQIVYNKNINTQLIEYRKKLEGLGAVVLLKQSQDLPCVLTAQLIRLLAFDLEFVSAADVIVTADVDAFVMTPDILKPLKLKQKNIWIWRYELTHNTGYTFMLPFIGATSSIWRRMLWYKGSLVEMVDHYGTLMDFKDDYTWDVDQHIVSRSILESGVCNLSPSNPLWKEVKLKPNDKRDRNCWHGSGIYEDCNNKLWTRNAMIRYQGGGCKWWHFYPDEGVKELEQKFKEIMKNRGDKGLLSSLLRGAKHIKTNYIDQFIVSEKIPRADPSGELQIWSDHKS